VVEFTLISVIALVLTLALIQLALFLWQRNVVMTALSEGARVAATAGRGPEDGRVAACTLMTETVGDRCATVSVRGAEEAGIVVMAADGTLPSFVPGMPDLPVHLRARMHNEEDLFPALTPVAQPSAGGPSDGTGG
jgi:hypothetical protein